ncbi:MAG: hypothetical protein P8M68_01265 [Aquiluna sp.]|nr:hypothetical protein [Aquiluna sp.]
MKNRSLKALLSWLAIILIQILVSYQYHPNSTLWIIGTILATGLTALVFWSATRISGPAVFLKVAVVAMVAAFMNSQAMDVAYSLLRAPAGNRLDLIFEVLLFGLLFLGLTLASKALILGSKKNK